MYKITIIIPHKNIPILLERCVNSIPERDDIQVVIVDDNSDIDKKPLIKRKEVKIILLNAEEAKGAGRARNIGLNYALGKWILFADADDFFNEGFDQVLESYFNSASDLIVFDTNSVLSDTLETVDNRENIVSVYKSEKDENILRYCHHAVWGKMFRHEMVKKYNIRFQDVAASNDAFFAACAGFYARKVKFVSNILYCCTVRRGSICTRVTLDNVKARIYVVKTVNSFLKSNKVRKKYWMNRLGPLFNLKRLSYSLFIKDFILYIAETSPIRIYYDFKESGGRFWNRLKGDVNDRDIKKMQVTG